MTDYENGMKREAVVRKYKISKSSLYNWIAEKAKTEAVAGA